MFFRFVTPFRPRLTSKFAKSANMYTKIFFWQKCTWQKFQKKSREKESAKMGQKN
jgi:hypothetical protein